MKAHVSRRPGSRRRKRIRQIILVSGAIAVVLIAGLGMTRFWDWMNSVASTNAIPTDPTVLAALGGTLFKPSPSNPSDAPQFQLVATFDAPNEKVIWGSMGRDHRGHLWFATSSDHSEPLTAKNGPPHPMTARLYEYDPASGSIFERGDSLDQLKVAGLLKPGESQQKIHTKIVEAPNGYLYFATSDETGAVMSGTKGPNWPSHVWRFRPGSENPAWEHLFTSPEALIAMTLGGRYIYALGWFGHVVYQYDTETGKQISERVGSSLGHISRNILADARGHVYVPRLTSSTSVPPVYTSVLVELDPSLRELGSVELPHYLGDSPEVSHGITGVQPMADGSIVFVTYAGYLYRVTPQRSGLSLVKELGRFHSTREVLVESLFTYDGLRYLVGLASPRRSDLVPNDWVVFDLETGHVTAEPVEGRIEPLSTDVTSGDSSRRQPAKTVNFRQLTLYGCATRDNEGNFYLVGRDATRPVILRARPPGMKVDNPKPVIRPAADHALAPVAKISEPKPADPWQARSTFRRELRTILADHGESSSDAITDLCRRSKSDLSLREQESMAEVAALGLTGPISLERKIQILREGDVPEFAILEDLAKTEAQLIGTRNGPVDKPEALVRAARRFALLPITPPKPGGDEPLRPLEVSPK